MVQLPDVTGLTVAVESPAKGQSHQPYAIGKDSEDKNGHGSSFPLPLVLLLLIPFQHVFS